MGGACSAYGGEERRIKGFEGEKLTCTWRDARNYLNQGLKNVGLIHLS